VRRKFVEAESCYPEECGRAIAWIGELYAVEREVARVPRDAPEEAKAEAIALRTRLRAEQSRLIINTLRDRAYATKPAVLPESSLGKAIDDMLSLWPGLTRFLSNHRVPLGNNVAERALRGVVVGRENHYGSYSKRGAEVAAICYTLFETAKLAGVDPHRYMLETTRRAILLTRCCHAPRRPDLIELSADSKSLSKTPRSG
jgi:transposase